jgi:GH25 family lysozyme M1 (1,4-beta-N-acetylmuramidase)
MAAAQGDVFAAVTRRAFFASVVGLGLNVDGGLAQPRLDLTLVSPFVGIIDIYQDNQIDLDLAWELGVRAIIHGTLYTHNGCKPDKRYKERKREALAKGFLWGAYCMMTSEDVQTQLARFLALEDGSNENILIALDWEPNRCGAASYEQVREAVTSFRKRLGFFPMIYGSPFFSDPRIQKGDALLGRCPLWYANYSGQSAPKSRPPAATWNDYTLWQYDDEHRNNGAPYPAKVLPGADWSKFNGNLDELKTRWPFRRA